METNQSGTGPATLMDRGRPIEELAESVFEDLEELLSDPQRLIIVVERHDRHGEHWRDHAAQDLYVWIKGKNKVTVKKVRHAYFNNCNEPGLRFSLKLGDTTPAEHLTMADVATEGQRFIIFSAMSEDAPESMPAQPPATPAGTRSGLNRQLSLPPKESVDEAKAPKLERDLFSTSAIPERPATPASQQRDSLRHVHAAQASTPTKASASVARRQGTAQGSATPGARSAAADDGQKYQPRDVGNPFAASQEEDEPVHMRGRPLQELTKDVTSERLEAGVQSGLRVLSDIAAPLEALTDNADAISWLAQIGGVRKLAVKNRTVVGVVGNTGAGKSSVINAMLDEERLVPTNCMRACTAVVTEMSYNDSTNEASRYRAEVEFIQPEDWRKELKVLFEEVFDENGSVVKDISNPDSSAGIAYAKIRAVYHKHTKEMLSRSTVDSLMKVKTVKGVLGTTKRINERETSNFYRRVQHFVDSKEKGTEKRDKNGNKITNPTREFEFWPLIKVVRIYTKADALSTGAVIVDLPGVHDSNAARAAVAEGYMKQCTGLWIVAPINRAVDDKAAKTLLGNTFKRQLKYDGTYSAVTFICSKTDDISRTEAADSLDLGEQMSALDDKLAEVTRRRRALETQSKELKGQKTDHTDVIEQTDESIEAWEDLASKLEDGETVYAPSTIRNKRKRRPQRSPLSRKKRKVDFDSDDDVEYIDSASEDGASSAEEREPSESGERTPLTREQIDDKLDDLRKLKKDARRERNNLDDQIREIRKQLMPLEEEESTIDAKQNALCIAGRNEYSRSAIQQDFAAGIRELDQENAEEEDPDHFNPDEDMRDYDQVARDLPVFCVSSRAYQKLSGRLKKDNSVQGFTSAEQTEIPQLQAHCKKLTENGRQASCRRFLNSIAQLLTSLGLWASDDGTGAKMTGQQRDAERGFLKRKLTDLSRALEKAVSDTLEDVEATLGEQIFDKFAPAVQAASTNATPTAAGWGAHRDAGGLHYMTYKATVRRQGVYQGASGLRDFNGELTEPVYKQLASSWEKAFQRRLPHILQSFTRSGTDLLRKFHLAIADRCRQRGHGIARIGMLENQLQAYQAIFGDLANAMIAQVNEGQREINREFTPVISQAMEPAYDACTNERGTGSFNRMKGHMATHVSQHCVSMFEDATEQVRKSILKMCGNVRAEMGDRADGIFISMQRDYMSIIGGVNIDTKMPRQERALRRDVDDMIGKADGCFQKVIDMTAEDMKKAGVGTPDVTESDDMEVDEHGEDVEDSAGEGAEGSDEEDDAELEDEDDDHEEEDSSAEGDEQDEP